MAFESPVAPEEVASAASVKQTEPSMIRAWAIARSSGISFLRHLAPVRTKRWVVYAKAPFAGPEAVLAYLSRYTHRVAISNSRLVASDQDGVTFRYKDCRRDGADRQQVMTLTANESIRRFLLHVLPQGFHRIRHYGLLAGSARKVSLALARELLDVATPPDTGDPEEREDFARRARPAADA